MSALFPDPEEVYQRVAEPPRPSDLLLVPPSWQNKEECNILHRILLFLDSDVIPFQSGHA